LAELRRELDRQLATCIGYPCATDFDYAALEPFLRYPLNNLGDPFAEHGTFRLATRAIEREVIAWFAELTHAPADGCWGYVTSGGTEGNLYGLYVARELLPDGLVYYSEATHYSVVKILRVLGMRHITVRAAADGTVDLEDLGETLRIHRDAPPIVLANVGTTMTEGVDDIAGIRELIDRLAIQRSYVHADAAFAGMTLPFSDGAPPGDFRAGVDSIAISGHKFIGAPVPCGVVLARRVHVDRIARSIEYIGARDTTLTGSRSGLAPLMLWYAIRRWGREGFRARVARGQELAEYAVRRFAERDVAAWRNPHALTVVFPRPPAALQERWQLAAEGDRAHLMTVPAIDEARIDAFIDDYCTAAEEEP
jgi:histidine decarboxylase